MKRKERQRLLREQTIIPHYPLSGPKIISILKERPHFFSFDSSRITQPMKMNKYDQWRKVTWEHQSRIRPSSEHKKIQTQNRSCKETEKKESHLTLLCKKLKFHYKCWFTYLRKKG